MPHVVVKLIVETAHCMGIAPIIFVLVRDRLGFKVELHYWWLAVALAISFMADSAAHWVDPYVVSVVYPLSQAVLVAACIVPRRSAIIFLGVLVPVGIFSVLIGKDLGGDAVLRTVAFLGVCVALWPLQSLGVLRLSLLCYFGASWVYWMAYAAWPSTATYLLHQSARFVGITLYCYSVARPMPKLRLIRTERAA